MTDLNLGPTAEEIEAWAASERRWRSGVLEGPDDVEKLAWAVKEKARRRRRVGMDAAVDWQDDPDVDNVIELQRRWSRLAELSTMGLWSFMWALPTRVLGALVDEGRRSEQGTPRGKRRRIQVEE